MITYSHYQEKREIIFSYMESSMNLLNKVKVYLAVILLQCGYAGVSIIAKFALNLGMNQHVFVVYRMVVATALIAPFAIVLERNSRSQMTFSIFCKIMLLSLFEPVMDQNMYYTGLKYTTATFTTAMCNILPALTFLLAWICRLERVEIQRWRSQAKLLGIVVTVGGAMLMAAVKGPLLDLPWSKGTNNSISSSTVAANKQDFVKGTLMLIVGCLSWSAFSILQAVVLRSYPAELSLTALICMNGVWEGTIFALVAERGNAAIWSIRMDCEFLAALFGGIASGASYYIIGAVVRERGPVFMSAFSPLSMIIVTLASSFILDEDMYFGRLIGAIIIVVGLYLVLWGKSRDRILNGNVETPSHEFVGVNGTIPTPRDQQHA